MASIEERVNKLDKTFARIGGIVAATVVFVLAFAGYYWYEIPSLVIEEMSRQGVAQRLSKYEEDARESAANAKRAAQSAQNHETKLKELNVKQTTQLEQLQAAIRDIPERASRMLDRAELFSCRRQDVGRSRSIEKSGNWCAPNEFITQFDLNHGGGVYVTTALCCRLRFP